MDAANHFHAHTLDWRESIKQNHQRTLFVLGTFVFIYLCIGFLVDLYINAGHDPQAPLSQLAAALFTLKLFPVATVIAGIVAILSVTITFAFHDKLILLGAKYREITPTSAQGVAEQQLYNVIEEMKIAADLHYMPKVYVIDADYMNAFASGYSEQSAMVAITRGLLEKCDRDELTAVMAHELSHIRHMDIKLTLMATVLSNITLILVDILFWNAFMSGRSNREGGAGSSRNILFLVIIVLRYVLPLATVLLMLYLSRTREYMADAGCVELMRNNEPLARALLKIKNDHTQNSDAYNQAYAETPHESVRRQAYIFDPVQAGIETHKSASDYFSTHPDIQKRLAAIGIAVKE